MNIFLFISLIFIFTFIIGVYLEKIHVPWIFASLILGVLLAAKNPFASITNTATFDFLAHLGMYSLLFLVGLELDLESLKRKSKFIITSSLFIILLEAAAGTLIVHFIFHYDLVISAIVALSFATVGEAILIPILDEYKIINTTLGNAIIGIGTADDFFEILSLIFVTLLVGSSAQNNVYIILSALVLLFILTIGLTKLKKRGQKFLYLGIESTFLFVLFILFLFVGIGYLADSAPLAALLAGISLGLFLPHSRLEEIKEEIRSLTYGFFAPIFFIWVGESLDLKYLTSYPLLIILVIAVSSTMKIIGSIIAAHNHLDLKQSILLGIGLAVRFSTSIVIIKILFDHHIIRDDIYSVTIASSIIFTFIIPILFSNLLHHWKLAK
jgi:Kef-type K+ transport system membrane component KefB